MRKLLLLGLCCFILTGCQDETKLLESELHGKLVAYVVGNVKELGDDISIDSVLILRIDTINAKVDSLASLNKLSDRVEGVLGLVKLQQQKVKLSIERAKLWKSMDAELHSMYLKDAQDELEESKALSKDLDVLSEQQVLLFELIKSGEIDSLVPTGYSVLFNLKARDSKNVAQDADSLRVIFDLDKRIKNNRI